MCPRVYSSIAIGLQVLLLLVDLLVAGNVCLEVTVLVLPSVLEGAQLLLKLYGAVLGEYRTKQTSQVLQNFFIQVLADVFC